MKKIVLLFTAIFLLFFVYNIFNKSFLSSLEIDKNATRQHYFFKGLGKIYKNRFGIYYFNVAYPRFTKFDSVLFSEIGKVYVYIPLFGFLIYMGNKNNNEK